MKKKLLLAFIAIIATLCCAFGFAACDLDDIISGISGSEEPGHTHTFDCEPPLSAFLKTEATCTQKAVYYYSCKCGEKGEETFEYGKLASHVFIDNVCGFCGEKGTNGLYYRLNSDDDGYSVGEIGTATDLDIYIPSTYKGLPVTSISKRAFEGCSELTSITIPDSVTSICDFAFYNCSSLTSITIPDSVTSIGMYAFYNCRSLTGITIPDSVTSIGSDAFRNCRSLTSIVIPDSVTSVGGYAFYNCRSLTSIVIPDSVTSIGSDAFYNCSSLTSVTIPNGVTSIGSSAFSYCSSLTNVTIPNGVTSIGNSAFNCCSGLTSITIGNGVTSISDYAFEYCSGLTSITFKGTKAQWNAIVKYEYWNYDTANCTIHCTDGDISK